MTAVKSAVRRALLYGMTSNSALTLNSMLRIASSPWILTKNAQ